MSQQNGQGFSVRKSIMDGMQAGEDVRKITGLFMGLATVLAQGLSMPWIMLFHHLMGERVVNTKTLIMSLACLYPAAMLYIGVQGLQGLFWVVLVAWSCQIAGIWDRRKKNIRLHSRSLGTPWIEEAIKRLPHSSPLRKLKPKYIECVIEPLLVVILVTPLGLIWNQESRGSFWTGGTPAIGVRQFFAYGLICGGSLAWVQAQRYQMAHNLLLDQIDQRIEAEEMARALDPDAHQEESGHAVRSVVLPGLADFSDEERAAIRSNFADLDPQIAALLDHSSDDAHVPQADASASHGQWSGSAGTLTSQTRN